MIDNTYSETLGSFFVDQKLSRCNQIKALLFFESIIFYKHIVIYEGIQIISSLTDRFLG